ncbi:MAG TPA: hypothetical protein VMU50_02765 [Polyangia bacterium]|nr:hypothetical protein [Polyangia bacterium]
MRSLSARPPLSSLRWGLPFLLIVAAPGAGCGDFQDVSTVVDLRVLDIRADPPELLVDPMNLGGPYTTRLTALIGDPAGGNRAVSVEALACPRSIDAVTAATGKNGIVCKPFDPQSGDADASVAVTAPPPAPAPTATRTAFGDAELALPFTFPTDLLVRAYQLDPYASVGFQLPIAFQLTVTAGAESEVAIKRVIFSVPPDGHADQTPNANPGIPALVAYATRDSAANAVDPQPVDLDQPLPVAPGGSLWLEPQGADTEAERYFTRELTHDPMPQVVVTAMTETLRYYFYATAGTFTPPSTNTVIQVLRSQPDRVHLEAQYQAPVVMPADPHVTFWIVVRDERGGSSWIKGRFLLAAP